ncbi:MAG TPA: uracil-DNA glycosylase [Candidatus Onthoplasma faecipullorum]|nr:uracil-DNA glycosylase [Candidatus Onthoplasma faecipullorum]
MSYVLEKNWSEIFSTRFDKDYKIKLFSWLNEEYKTKRIFPPQEKIFNALNLVPIDKVKVVIIGQDPYHTYGQADGLAFSCHNGTPQPSLKNIFKEIHDDLRIDMSSSTDLTPWAKQGVLLLNTSLTVVEHKPASHANELWHTFTREIIKILNERNQPIVFLLWGNHAKSFMPLLNNPNHLVLTSAHPSPFSAYSGFFGCRHFSKANKFLTDHNLTPIDWKI